MREEQVAVAGPLGFFTRRWRRQVPLGQLFWHDMVVVGSAVNIAAALAGLMALAMKASVVVPLLLIHAPLPYNIFLVAAVWRTADLAGPNAASSARFGAVLWLIASAIV